MIALAILLAVALVCVLGAPRLLRLRPGGVRRPRLLLTAWLGAFLTGAAAAIGSVLWSVMLALAARTEPVDVGWLAGVGAWSALAVTGAACALVLTRAEPFRAGRDATSRNLDLLAATCTERTGRIGGVPVLVVRAAKPLAFSSTSDGGRVVVTSGLVAALSAVELRAVLEHERAHLTGRHDLLLLVARLNRACVPVLLGARSFDQAVHVLVELAADDRAAAVCGRAALASALRATARLDANEWVDIRAARLEAPAPAGRTGVRGTSVLYKL